MVVSKTNRKTDRILDFVRDHPGATNKEIAYYLGLTFDTVQRHMSKVKKEWRRELQLRDKAKSRKM